LILDL